ncbi:FixH family protein [Virgibacillus dokdonensis]|uniref:YtkA-like domain-containing protein n=1 Tax=Virgibacillus dokdonensis TaxID=302167 RepID=A0A2K9J5C9_9BACI|nr:FixH family protein [Virgibacillus dokdonensis]AUJ26934.1 hypothetical protein A21D_03900 [Virgibacillus dokdonensis]
MRRRFWMFIGIIALILMTACGQEEKVEKSTDAKEEEPKELKVDFEVPESAEVGDTVELKATVTYGEEKVTDADEVVFEVWEKGKKDDSTNYESTNHEDGTYTAEVTFDNNGVYEMFAHTTARDLHTMPQKAITVGDVENPETKGDEEHANHEGTDGFALHFMEPENVAAGEETELMVHLQMNEKPLEEASVRYEIGRENTEDKEWVDAEEGEAGEYTGSYTFTDKGKYQLIVHVENDDDLHEHEEYEITVEK